MLTRYILLLACFCFVLPCMTVHAEDLPPSRHHSSFARFWENYLDQDCFKDDIEALACGDKARDGILQAKNPERARYWYEKSLSFGNKDALLRLAHLYSYASNGHPNIEKAVYWYEQAIKQGIVDAMLELPQFYSDGINIKPDYERTIYWYKQAADKGNLDAIFDLAQFYSDGTHMKPDYERARYWYNRGVALNDAPSMVNLANMYEFGQGGPKDISTAFQLRQKSVSLNDPDGMVSLGQMYMNGLGTPQNRQKGLDLYKRSAAQGDSGGQYMLGMAYHRGWGTAKNDDKAFRLFRKAARQGLPEGMLALANIYESPKHNYKNALNWFTQAADHGSVAALYGLIVLYDKGLGTKPDPQAVQTLAQKLVQLKGPSAFCGIAQEYRPDPTGTYDYKRAIYWYEAAATHNEQCAYASLATFYFLGQGVMRDFQKARYWYEKSAPKHEASAEAHLASFYETGKADLPKDPDMAQSLYKQACHDGDTPSCDRVK